MTQLKYFEFCIILIMFSVLISGEESLQPKSSAANTNYQWNEKIINTLLNQIVLLKNSNEIIKMQLAAFNEISKTRLEAANDVLKMRLDAEHMRIKNLLEKFNHLDEKLDALVNSSRSKKSLPSNCAEILVSGKKNAIHTIKVESYGSEPFQVYCNFTIQGGDWTVIQRRVDGSEDFTRGWDDYKKGFGALDKEFFIGLDKLYALTKKSDQELLIVMRDFDGNEKYAKYENFQIGDESENYLLFNLGKYSGNAGDSLRWHEYQNFSTIDRDNDNHSTRNCGREYKGGWWYNSCFESNLNGPYSEEGIHWVTWTKFKFSLTFVEMLIRPKNIHHSIRVNHINNFSILFNN